MTQELIKVSVIGIMASVFALVLRKNNGELALLLGLCSALMILCFLFKFLEPVIEFLNSLGQLAKLDNRLLEPLFKVVGVGLLSQICTAICTEGGQLALAKSIDFAGTVLTLYLALPLLTGIVQLFSDIGGVG